jgi:hypothetical protein
MGIDSKQLFMTAEVFRASSIILGSLINREMPHYMFPMVTCSAFSLELHLKCLVLIENGTLERGHDLEELFSKVTSESRKMILANYETKRPAMDARFAAVQGAPQPPTDFDSVLHASAKAFEKFRYAYEGSVKDQEGWMADPIRDCVRERILELRQDWVNLSYGFNGPLLPREITIRI